jgi:hypothetical protein
MAVSLLAGAALVAAGVSAAPADAVTDVAAPTPLVLTIPWGPGWSIGHLAKASGHFIITVVRNSADPEKPFIDHRITGKLWDRDPLSPCASIEFRTRANTTDKWHPAKSYKKCGVNGYRKIGFRVGQDDRFEFRVCQIGKRSDHHTKCGRWTIPHFDI